MIHSKYAGLIIRNLLRLVISREFITLAFLGNTIVLLASVAFFYIEKGHNPKVNELMDSVWFSFTTFTTVGYGDIVPVTFWGRILGIGMMLGGTVIFVTFTALFADVILSSKITHIEGRLRDEDQKIKELSNIIRSNNSGDR